jgi:hypothetical protein
LRNDAQAIAAIDLCVVPTLTFERLFVFLVLGHGRRHLPGFEVTRHPTAEWLARQITEAFPWASAPVYLVRDNDRANGHAFKSQIYENLVLRFTAINCTRDRLTSMHFLNESAFVPCPRLLRFLMDMKIR